MKHHILITTALGALGLCALGVPGAGAAAIAATPAAAQVAGPGSDPTPAERALLEEPGVAGVAVDADGRTVVYADGTAIPDVPHSARVLTLPGPLTTLVDTTAAAPLDPAEVPAVAIGGAGYVIAPDEDGGALAACSLGFIAISPEGGPAALTAGHCAAYPDYPNVSLTRPSTDPGAGTGGAGWDEIGDGYLGRFGFHQFGGPGDSDGANGSATATDIAVVDIVSPTTTIVPAVTTWAAAADDDLITGAVEMTEVGPMRQGVPVTKSGRSTGSTTASVTAYTLGWFNVSGHWVHGYGISGITLAAGDSGGAVYQGSRAIGIASGGSGSFLVAADFETSLPLTGGYTLDLVAP